MATTTTESHGTSRSRNAGGKYFTTPKRRPSDDTRAIGRESVRPRAGAGAIAAATIARTKHRTVRMAATSSLSSVRRFVHDACRWRHGAHFARGMPEAATERPVEVRHVVEAHGVRNFDDAPLREAWTEQHRAGAFEPLLQHELGEARAFALEEHPHVPRAHLVACGNSRQ